MEFSSCATPNLVEVYHMHFSDYYIDIDKIFNIGFKRIYAVFRMLFSKKKLYLTIIRFSEVVNDHAN